MQKYFVKRILWIIPTLWVIATLTFFFLRLIPGGPFDQERQLPPEIKKNLEKRYGLDKPLPIQYLHYLKGLSMGDPGPSLKYLGRGTQDIIRETFPVSLQLGTLAMAMALLLGIPMGVLAAASQNSRFRFWDTIFLFITSCSISMPNFVFASLLILFFSFTLKWLPPALWEGPTYALMPALTLALYPMAYIARLIRSSMMDSLKEDYIQTARAKGVKEWQIIFKHAFRNSLTSAVSIIGPITAALITGSFIVEYIFAIPGMGQYFVTAVTNRDYPLVLGVTMVYAVFIIVLNLLVDLAYTRLDPRIKLT